MATTAFDENLKWKRETNKKNFVFFIVDSARNKPAENHKIRFQLTLFKSHLFIFDEKKVVSSFSTTIWSTR